MKLKIAFFSSRTLCKIFYYNGSCVGIPDVIFYREYKDLNRTSKFSLAYFHD